MQLLISLILDQSQNNHFSEIKKKLNIHLLKHTLPDYTDLKSWTLRYGLENLLCFKEKIVCESRQKEYVAGLQNKENQVTIRFFTVILSIGEGKKQWN